MRRITTALLALVCVLGSLVIAFGQSAPTPPSVTVPRLIHITGAFQPVDGQPPAPIETVTLSIYSDSDGGLPVWQERQSVAVEKTTGRFTLLLGASNPAGIPAEVFASGDGQWMSLLFERAGEREQARVRIASVPYALKASDAETLGGLPASAYLRAPTAAPIESVSETSSVASAAVTATEGPSLAAVLPGTTNFLAKYVNASDVGNSAIYEAGGAVGIGTTAPLDLMHVRFTNTNGGATGLAVQNLGNTTTSYSGMLFYDQFGALGQFQGFNNVTHEYRINNIATNASINFMTASTSRFFIAPSGNVGIGTAAPAQKLHVAGDIAANGSSSAGQFNIGSVRILAAPGTANLVAGAGSGAALTSGQQNAFFGFEAGAANTTATRNSFFGSSAGQLTTGASNSFFGGSAGVNNTTGSANVFVGTAAGNGSTTGSDNVFVGAFTGHDSVSTASDNVLVGSSAGRNNRGSANTFVGGDAGRENALGTLNAFFGFSAGDASTTGSSNTFIGYSAGETNTTGGANTLIGASTDVAADDLTFATAIGASSVATESNSISLGRSAGQDSVYIWGVLRVGLDGAGALDVCRNASFRLSTCSSSIRYKRNVETYGAGMEVVRRLRPITFTWTSDGTRDLGFAAEEVAAIDPLLAIYTDKGAIEGVKYKQLTTVLVNAANEQQRLIEQQQRQIDEQQRQIDALLHLVCGQNSAAELCSESRAARDY